MFVRRLVAAGCAVLLAIPAAARDSEPQKITPNGEKIICKRTEETGSLVKATKRCYTRMQWDRIAEAARAKAQRLVTDSSHPYGAE